MGEIADGIINGDFDFYTGEYIGRGFGIPRTKNGQLPWAGTDTSWKKVVGFLNNCSIKAHLHPEIVKAFGAPYPRKAGLKKACAFILKDFDKFKAFVAENKQKWITKPLQSK